MIKVNNALVTKIVAEKELLQNFISIGGYSRTIFGYYTGI